MSPYRGDEAGCNELPEDAYLAGKAMAEKWEALEKEAENRRKREMYQAAYGTGVPDIQPRNADRIPVAMETLVRSTIPDVRWVQTQRSAWDRQWVVTVNLQCGHRWACNLADEILEDTRMAVDYVSRCLDEVREHHCARR